MAEPKFKNGDRVRIVARSRDEQERTGTVESITSWNGSGGRHYVVRFDGGYIVNGRDVPLLCGGWELEPLDAEAAKSGKPIDKFSNEELQRAKEAILTRLGLAEDNFPDDGRADLIVRDIYEPADGIASETVHEAIAQFLWIRKEQKTRAKAMAAKAGM